MTAPDADRWRRLREAFAVVADAGPEARTAILARLRPELASLTVELDRLLSESESAPLADSSAMTRLWRDAVELPPGTRVAAFTVTRPLGRGGMAQVYEARQASPDRDVALKVMLVDIVSDDARRRFEAEAAALARLVHPHVAQVHEFGVAATELGSVCYLAMERIAGARTLTEHVRDLTLPLPERIELLARVCDAVHFGHQRGVIHRDLKPANILVDEHGAPKLIDFGVARLADAADATTAGQLVGTLGYMSPEQIEADPTAIDVRTDVYALGIVLHEILTGRLPHDLRGLSWAEGLARMRASPTPVEALAEARVPADLAAVVRKATERTQSERYASAAELAKDLRRFLTHLPVEARPPSRGRELRLLLRRHRAVAFASSIAALALVVAALLSTFSARRERLASTAERQQRVLAEETVTTLCDALLAGSPTEARGRAISAKDLIAAAAERLSRRALPALVEAKLRDTIGTVFHHLGDADRAEPHLRAAVELFTTHLGPDHRDTLTARDDLTMLLTATNRLDEALKVSEDVFERRTRHHGAATRETLVTAVRTAEIHRRRGNLRACEDALERVAAVAPREGRDPDEACAYFEARAKLANARGDHAAALAALRDATSIAERTDPEDHPRRLFIALQRGEVLLNAGLAAEAEPLLRDTLVRCERVFGSAHAATVGCSARLAQLLAGTGRATDAVPFAEAAWAHAEQALDPTHPATLVALDALAMVFLRNSRNADAAQVYRRCWDVSTRVRGAEHPGTLNFRSMLGVMLARSGSAAEGLAHATAAYETLLATAGETLPQTLTAKVNLAALLEQDGQLERSLGLRRRWLELRAPTLGADHPDVARVRKAVARLEAALGAAKSQPDGK